MRFVRTTTAALVSRFLMSGAYALAWSAPPMSHGLTGAQATSANSVVQAAGTILAAPEFPQNHVRPDALNNCKQEQMYSAHDIVGDPQACIMRGISRIDGVRSTVAGAPALQKLLTGKYFNGPVVNGVTQWWFIVDSERWDRKRL